MRRFSPRRCGDVASLQNFIRELSESYRIYLGAAEAEDVEMQYADVAEWQNRLLEDEESQAFSRSPQFASIAQAGL